MTSQFAAGHPRGYADPSAQVIEGFHEKVGTINCCVVCIITKLLGELLFSRLSKSAVNPC